MNAEFLLSALSRFGDHPDRIQEFRKVIVGLAISGRLAGQNEHQAPSELLEAIEVRKAELFARREIAKPKQYAAITDEQLPPQFTDASAFVALGSVARIEKGLTGIQHAQPGPYPLVVTGIGRSNCDHFDFAGPAAIIPLVSSTGHGHASINRLHYQEGEFALGTILAAVVPFAPDLISARFLFEYLSTFKDELLVSRMTGTANVTLSIGRIAEVPIPLAPPSAQRKVDELMALCDQLETARAGREAGRDKLTLSTMAKLNEPDPETFADDARFALKHLEPLTVRTDQIKRLRQTILNLAVRGKLVEQDPNDEPASELLKRVELARMAQGLELDFQPTDDAVARPYQLPPSWIWVRLGQITRLPYGKLLPTSELLAEGYPVFGANGIIGRYSRYLYEEEMLLISCRGANSGVPNISPPKCYVTNNSLVCEMYEPAAINIRFLHSFLAVAPREGFVTGTAQPQVTASNAVKMDVPLPPIAEQHRIVAKVNELMALCDQLEASLSEGEQARSKLLDAVLHQALEPA